MRQGNKGTARSRVRGAGQQASHVRALQGGRLRWLWRLRRLSAAALGDELGCGRFLIISLWMHQKCLHYFSFHENLQNLRRGVPWWLAEAAGGSWLVWLVELQIVAAEASSLIAKEKGINGLLIISS